MVYKYYILYKLYLRTRDTIRIIPARKRNTNGRRRQPQVRKSKREGRGERCENKTLYGKINKHFVVFRVERVLRILYRADSAGKFICIKI